MMTRYFVTCWSLSIHLKYRRTKTWEIIMKKFLAVIATCILTLSGAHAVVLFTPVGPAAFKLNAIVQETTFQQTGGKTNQSATSTNITTVFKATIGKTSFDSSDMLALLANSFNTNFPAGSQIGMRFAKLVVVDSTGTNIIFDPSGVVSFQLDEEFVSGVETETLSAKPSGTQEGGSLSEVLTSSVTLSYDDTLNTTQDGTHTKFAFKGLYTVQLSENLKTHGIKTTATFQGTGGGPVRGVQTILTGTISGKASGTVPVF